jgi:hypothetical protein
MRVEFGIGEYKYKPTHWSGEFFFPLTFPFYIFVQLFSDLASKNTETLTSLASVLKNLHTPA